MSKGGFMFPVARFLPEAIHEFETNFLSVKPEQPDSYEGLIQLVAPIHSELLYLHPFREGNGRTARLLADLIAMKFGFEKFDFEKITEERMPVYIKAVQAASDKNYQPMIDLFKKLER